MKGFLDTDSSFGNRINKLTDLLLLNLLFMLSCVPIVTIGASVTALYSVTLKMVKNEEGYISRDFRHSFIGHLKKAILLGGILLMIGIFLAFDIYYYVFSYGRELSYVVKYLFYLFFICYLFLGSYVFVILGEFNSTVKNTLISSIQYAVRFLPYTLGIVFFNMMGILLVFLFPKTLAYVLTILIFGGFSGIAYINSHIFQKVLRRIAEEDAVFYKH